MCTNTGQFLTQGGEARVLTNELISVIRQQRHTGTRVAIATQEPTLSPELIALANATFVHRFLSPNWYEMLKKHLAGANKRDPGHQNSLFSTIVGLHTGQALLFCPTARMDIDEDEDGSHGGNRAPKPLKDEFVHIRVRKRLTVDGGRSIMATDAPASAPDVEVDDIPMFHPETSRRRDEAKTKSKERKKISGNHDQDLDLKADSVDAVSEEHYSSVLKYERLRKAIEFSGFIQGDNFYKALDKPLAGPNTASLGELLDASIPLAHYLAEKRGWKAFSTRTKKARASFIDEMLKGFDLTRSEVKLNEIRRWFPPALDPYMVSNDSLCLFISLIYAG